MTGKKFTVSQSKVKQWRKCHFAFHLKYVEQLRAKKKARPLHFGSLIHKALENRINGLSPMSVLKDSSIQTSGLFSVEVDEQLETLRVARIIMKEYSIQYQDDPISYLKIGDKKAEHSFEIEIMKDVVWNGKIDAIGTTKKNGLRWLVEHKTFSRLPSTDDRWRNLQSATYYKAIDILGWKPVDGVCWDYIGSKAPPVSGILKDGKLSQKRLKTLPTALRRFIKDQGMDPKEYSEFIRLSEARSEWFQRIYNPVNDQVKQLLFNDFLDSTREMIDGIGVKKSMNIERHCGWCEFEPICRATLQGLDVDYVKERQYEKSTKSDEDEDSIHRAELGD